jgi:hypothetical protein
VTVPILSPEHRWQCPTCGLQHVTHEARPHTPMHPCRGLAGFLAPFAQVHGNDLTGVTHRVVEREDYIAGERVQVDGDGRPVMAIHTERQDGYDTHVYAATATATGDN